MDTYGSAQADAGYLGRDAYAGEAVAAPAYLDGISEVANQAERAADLIEGFIGRFRGGKAETSPSSSPQPVPSGHSGQLERLARAVGTVCNLASDLRSIG